MNLSSVKGYHEGLLSGSLNIAVKEPKSYVTLVMGSHSNTSDQDLNLSCSLSLTFEFL